VLHGWIDLVPVRLRVGLIGPGRLVVFALRRIESGEEALLELEFLADDVRPRGWIRNVLLVVAAGAHAYRMMPFRNEMSGPRADRRVDVRRLPRCGVKRGSTATSFALRVSSAR